MQVIKAKIEGTVPLMIHADTLCNPMNPLTKEMKSFTGKRKKTDEDIAEIARIEWFGGLHYDKVIGPYVPGHAVNAMLVNAAKLQKRGKDVKRGIMVIETKVPIEYEGPRDPQKMFGKGDTEFVDIRSVVVQRARLMRCRPIFNKWSLQFTIAFNPDVFNRDDVLRLLEDGGQMIGLCEQRPYYGKFKITGTGK